MARKVVQIPYAPREVFYPFHTRTERWACLVAHRRAGKTVSFVNDLIEKGLTRKRLGPMASQPMDIPGHYAYIAPYRAQAKALVWDYLKHYAHGVSSSYNESELTVRLISGGSIRLFGADNADAMRGLGFDGVDCDEFGDFRPSVWGNVIRPTLSDRQGWAAFGGTPKGHNQFYDIHRVAETNEDWLSLILRASETGLIPQEELDAARSQLSQDQYDQEYECSFDAAILGAYYGVELNESDHAGRICAVPYDSSVPVNTAWDIGHTDDTSIWWYQNVGSEVHVLDFFTASGIDPKQAAQQIIDRPYAYGTHWLPHDARAKTFASFGKSTIEILGGFLGIASLAIVPSLSVQDGIQAVRMILPRTYFDKVKCSDGIEALRQYQRDYNEDTKAFMLKPLHNFASHPADAFRMLAVAEKRHTEKASPAKGKNVLELTLDELWEYTENRPRRDMRI